MNIVTAKALMNNAKQYFSFCLEKNPRAIKYLKSRNTSQEMIEKFDLGINLGAAKGNPDRVLTLLHTKWRS